MCPLPNDRIIGEPEQVLLKAPDFQNQRGCSFVAQAEALRAQGNWAEALEYYRLAQDAFAVLDNDRNRVAIWTWIAEAHRARQEWKEVAEYCCCALQDLDDLAVASRGARQCNLTDEYVEWQQRILQALEEALVYYVPKVGEAALAQLSGPQKSAPGGALSLMDPTQTVVTIKPALAREGGHEIRLMGEERPAP